MTSYDLRFTNFMSTGFMSKGITITAGVKARDKGEFIFSLVQVATRLVESLSEETRQDLLIKLVVHGLAQDIGCGGLVDAVELLQSEGVYMGEAARAEMQRCEAEEN